MDSNSPGCAENNKLSNSSRAIVEASQAATPKEGIFGGKNGAFCVHSVHHIEWWAIDGPF